MTSLKKTSTNTNTPPSPTAQPHWMKRGLLAWALWPLSLLFGLIVKIRRWWLTSFKKPWRASVPIVIVGNITAGGAGKTPTAIALIEHLIKNGHSPALVSRGYGRERPIACVEVQLNSDPQQVGDEPLLIKRRTGVPIFVANQRTKAVINVLEKHPQTTVIISDDGLQHYALARDIEIAVFDERGICNGCLLPAGLLREPLSRAKEVDFVIYNAPTPPLSLTGFMAQRGLGGYMSLSDWFKQQSAHSDEAHKNSDTTGSIKNITWQPMAQIAQKQQNEGTLISAVAGIGNPQRFFDMLQDEAINLEHSLALPDHYDYTLNSFDTIGSDMILITEKDAAKCISFKDDARLQVVTLSYTLSDEFFQQFDALLNKHQLTLSKEQNKE